MQKLSQFCISVFGGVEMYKKRVGLVEKILNLKRAFLLAFYKMVNT